MGQTLFLMPNIKYTSQIIASQVAVSLHEANDYPIQLRGVIRDDKPNDAIRCAENLHQ